MDGQAGAVDNEMEGLGGASPVEQDRLQRAAASGQGGVIRCLELEPHHREKRMEQALGLSKWQVENQAQGEDGFDCQVGKLLAATLLAVVLGGPGLDGFLREPEGDVASVSERPVVLGPVGHPIPLLVLWIPVSFVCFLHCGLHWIGESNG